MTMEEKDFKTLLSLIQNELVGVGLAELAQIESYEEEAGEPLDYKTLCVRMLKAFDEHLSLLDRRTVQASMKRIRGDLKRGKGPKDAVIEIPENISEVSDVPRMVRLSDLPNLSRLRNSVRKLVRDLAEEPYRRSPSDIRQ